MRARWRSGWNPSGEVIEAGLLSLKIFEPRPRASLEDDSPLEPLRRGPELGFDLWLELSGEQAVRHVDL